MTDLSLVHPVERSQTVMKTILKPLTFARRKAGLLVAAGVALASLLQPAPASAQATHAPELKLEKPDRPGTDSGSVRPFFSKIVLDNRKCDTVTYVMTFGVQGDPAKLADPAFAESLSKYRMDLSDQMPNGLTVIGVTATGDGTDAAGGPLPAPMITTTADPNDTAALSNFRLSASDLDGIGKPDMRYIRVKVVARIDPLAFPGPTAVANQGFVTVTRPSGAAVHIPSHDPAIPDDADFLTGEKTVTIIDGSGCEPPPPPGDGGPCFEVVNGEVDCVPGGGAFIYHMPAGPELGGKWVQVRTTTPGIDVAPGPQLVPAGGGVLDWTIAGASPGDVIQLIVTGIETYAGPAEGVGLCCTQTVEIVIPPDLDCPDEEREPDLKVEKRADVANCTKEGGCDYTITVTNVGDAPYNGKIVLDEVTMPGNATVDSGPNAPWACVPMASPMACEHPATTLNPGQSVELKLGFEPGPGWAWAGIRNCAAYNYAASGKDLFGVQTNDKACASIPICVPGRDRECTPPAEKRTDLTIRKHAATPVCSLDGFCVFVISVINSGTSTINGPLTVIDTYPAGVPASSTFGPTPPWTCGPDGVGQYRCEHPGIVLVPGASTPITVKTVAGAGYGHDQIENCAEVLPVPGETNLGNNKACAKARVPNRDPQTPPLKVEKTGDKECVAGQPCTFEITITNGGDTAFQGIVRIGDALEVGGFGRLEGVPITGISPPFGCAEEPSTLPLACDANLSLGAGESRMHKVTVVIPDDGRFASQTGELEGRNCVAVLEPQTPVRGDGGASDGLAGTGRGDLGDAVSCHRFTLSKKEAAQCSEGFTLNADGRCVCPEGTTFRNGTCSGDKVPTPRPQSDPKPRQCTLLQGQIRTNDGRCICPRGTELKGNACRTIVKEEPPVRQCKLLPGQVRTNDGRCVCRKGTELRDGACRAIVREQPPVRQCTLLPGQVRTKDGRCVCARGTTLVNGACRAVEKKPVECRKGQRLVKGECVNATAPRTCPQGTVGTPPNCRKVEGREPPKRIIPKLVNPDLLKRVLPRREPNGQRPQRQPQVQ